MHVTKLLSAAAVFSLMSVPSIVAAQSPCGDTVRVVLTDLTGTATTAQRTDELTGMRALSNPLIRGVGDARVTWMCSTRSSGAHQGQRVTLLPVVAGETFNNGYEANRNNGPLWEGRGFNLFGSAGARVDVGPLTVQVAPFVAWVQNRGYPIVPDTNALYSKFTYPWVRVDQPQRFGDKSFNIVDPGNSYARVHAGPVAAEVSTSNMWWGPGDRYSVLMTNTAPGFPHLAVGTDGDRNTPIGAVRAELVWGRLKESSYFDSVSSNDHRVFISAVASWQPKWVPGLYVGGGRVFQDYASELGKSDYFDFLQGLLKKGLVTDSTAGGDAADQLLSLFFSWNFQPSQLRLYGEWGRNDHAWDLNDLVSEPEHSAAYVMGLQKGFGQGLRTYRFTFESIRLGGSRDDTRRGSSWYRHSRVRQGYMNDGQPIGAAIGGEGDAQYLALDMLNGPDQYGAYLERERRHEDVFIKLPKMFSYAAHDLELTAGLRVSRTLGNVRITAQPAYSSRSNRDFRFCNNTVKVFRDCRLPQYRESNFQFPISVSWMW